MNKFERQHLMQLVLDCDTYRLSEKEALDYIKTRFGKPISARQYYRNKQKIHSEGTIRSWFDKFTKVGFALAQKRRIDEMELIQKSCMNLLKAEMDKPKSERNNDWLLKLIGEIRKNNAKLAETNLDNPIIDAIKKRIDTADERARLKIGKDYDITKGTAFS